MSATACYAVIGHEHSHLVVGRCILPKDHDGEHLAYHDSGRVEWRWNTGDTRPTITITREGS